MSQKELQLVDVETVPQEITVTELPISNEKPDNTKKDIPKEGIGHIEDKWTPLKVDKMQWIKEANEREK